MKVLKINDLLDVLHDMDHPRAGDYQARCEALMSEMATIISDYYNINRTRASYDGVGEGMYVSFGPRTEEQVDNCPNMIDASDESGEWDWYDNVHIHYGPDNEPQPRV